jgi:hypothetical protein
MDGNFVAKPEKVPKKKSVILSEAQRSRKISCRKILMQNGAF